MSKTRISAFDRLKELPEVFTVNTTVSTLDCTRGMASTYIARWRENGFISSLGPRAGVHFNLLKNPRAAEELRMEAIGYLFPGAVVAGVSAVHAAGWTTQFPRQTEIFIPNRRSYPSVDDAEIHCRPLSWMKMAKQWVKEPGPVPYLDPAFALADCVHSGIWTPDPDDIEWDEADAPALSRAFGLFDMELPDDWVEELEFAQRDKIDLAL